MKIFYTGAFKFNQPQLDPSKSLGGLISSTEVPNGEIGALWSAITKYTIYNIVNKGDYRAIVIQNDDTVTLTGLKAYFSYPDENDSWSNTDLFAAFQIGSEDVQSDNCGDLSIQSIASPFAVPRNVQFYMADGGVNEFNLPDLAPNQYIGIWLKRTITSFASQPLTSDQYIAIMNQTLQLPTLEQIDLNFIWD